MPYLRPYDLFDYVPIPADQLSYRRTTSAEELKLSPGTIVLPASGRNLGPSVAVDRHLAGFVLSHDAIRIAPHAEADLPYLLTFLNSPTGQSMIRSTITGSVIDHVGVADIVDLQVPQLPMKDREAVAHLMRASIRLRENSRLALAKLSLDLQRQLPPIRPNRSSDGWTVSAASLNSRFDAAPFHPLVSDARAILQTAGGRRLCDVAVVRKPASRYKAFHVKPDFGVPFLTGGQLRQSKVIAPKYMAHRVFEEPEKYRLDAVDTIFAADGRAYEGLGVPVLVTPDRDGWLASEHVMRLRPKEGVSAGALYLASTTQHVQLQLQALARGSVVDTLYEHDVMDIYVPEVDERWGISAEHAWNNFALANALERHATVLFESSLANPPQNVATVFVTVEEAAALLEVDGNVEVYRLVARGVLTPVGKFDERNLLLSLEEVLTAATATSPDAESAEDIEWLTVSGEVLSVSGDFFRASVVDPLRESEQEVEFPLSALSVKDMELITPGIRFLWKIPQDPHASEK